MKPSLWQHLAEYFRAGRKVNGFEDVLAKDALDVAWIFRVLGRCELPVERAQNIATLRLTAFPHKIRLHCLEGIADGAFTP